MSESTMLRSIRLVPSGTRLLVGWPPVFWLIAIGALVVRLYLASLWLRFGVAKLAAGWLDTNPVRGLLTAVAAGQTPMPIPPLAVVASWLLALRLDVVLSVVLPLIEISLAAAFLTGWRVRHGAVLGIAINTSLILAGLASIAFDGRIIALQLLVLLAGRRAGEIGVPGAARLLGDARSAVASLVEDATGPEGRRRAA